MAPAWRVPLPCEPHLCPYRPLSVLSCFIATPAINILEPCYQAPNHPFAPDAISTCAAEFECHLLGWAVPSYEG